MPDPLTDYRRHLTRRCLASSTINRYMIDLRAAQRHLGDLAIVDATTEDLEAFLDSRDLMARARYRWISELHSFYLWASSHGRATQDPTVVIDRPRLSRLLPRPVSDETLRSAMSAAGPQMKAWLSLAAFGGLRCAEIATLDRAGLTTERVRVKGKGGHERIVPLHDSVRLALSQTHLARTGPVFRREGGQPYTPKEVSRRGALYFEMIGYPGVTLHQLRHAFITRVVRYTKNLRAAQELAGHADPGTTASYSAVVADDLESIMRDLPGL